MYECKIYADSKLFDSRSQILQHHGLCRKSFDTEEAFFEAADQLIAAQRAEMPAIADTHPDKIFQNMPKLSQFWYVASLGA